MKNKYSKPEILVEKKDSLNLCINNSSNEYEDMGEFDEAIKKEGLKF